MYNTAKNLFKLLVFKKKWRKMNPNNKTTAKNHFNPKNIKVGRQTYGPLNIYQWGAENEGLEIGSFVSIASGVKFILGGNHYYNTFSTYPFKVNIIGDNKEAYSNGKIIISDDVWIGMDVIIMSGVNIGQGAVIAAGSVVTKDVEPYSIVGGNPATLIKYRFPDKVISELITFNFSNLDLKNVIDNIDLMYKPLCNQKEAVERIGLLQKGE